MSQKSGTWISWMWAGNPTIHNQGPLQNVSMQSRSLLINPNDPSSAHLLENREKPVQSDEPVSCPSSVLTVVEEMPSQLDLEPGHDSAQSSDTNTSHPAPIGDSPHDELDIPSQRVEEISENNHPNDLESKLPLSLNESVHLVECVDHEDAEISSSNHSETISTNAALQETTSPTNNVDDDIDSTQAEDDDNIFLEEDNHEPLAIQCAGDHQENSEPMKPCLANMDLPNDHNQPLPDQLDASNSQQDSPTDEPDTQPDLPDVIGAQDTQPTSPGTQPDAPSTPITQLNAQDAQPDAPGTPDTQSNVQDVQPNSTDVPDTQPNAQDAPDAQPNAQDTQPNAPDSPDVQLNAPDTQPDAPDAQQNTPDASPTEPSHWFPLPQTPKPIHPIRSLKGGIVPNPNEPSGHASALKMIQKGQLHKTTPIAPFASTTTKSVEDIAAAIIHVPLQPDIQPHERIPTDSNPSPKISAHVAPPAVPTSVSPTANSTNLTDLTTQEEPNPVSAAVVVAPITKDETQIEPSSPETLSPAVVSSLVPGKTLSSIQYNEQQAKSKLSYAPPVFHTANPTAKQSDDDSEPDPSQGNYHQSSKPGLFFNVKASTSRNSALRGNNRIPIVVKRASKSSSQSSLPVISPFQPSEPASLPQSNDSQVSSPDSVQGSDSIVDPEATASAFSFLQEQDDSQPQLNKEEEDEMRQQNQQQEVPPQQQEQASLEQSSKDNNNNNNKSLPLISSNQQKPNEKQQQSTINKEHLPTTIKPRYSSVPSESAARSTVVSYTTVQTLPAIYKALIRRIVGTTHLDCLHSYTSSLQLFVSKLLLCLNEMDASYAKALAFIELWQVWLTRIVNALAATAAIFATEHSGLQQALNDVCTNFDTFRNTTVQSQSHQIVRGYIASSQRNNATTMQLHHQQQQQQQQKHYQQQSQSQQQSPSSQFLHPTVASFAIDSSENGALPTADAQRSPTPSISALRPEEANIRQQIAAKCTLPFFANVLQHGNVHLKQVIGDLESDVASTLAICYKTAEELKLIRKTSQQQHNVTRKELLSLYPSFISPLVDFYRVHSQYSLLSIERALANPSAQQIDRSSASSQDESSTGQQTTSELVSQAPAIHLSHFNYPPHYGGGDSSPAYTHVPSSSKVQQSTTPSQHHHHLHHHNPYQAQPSHRQLQPSPQLTTKHPTNMPRNSRSLSFSEASSIIINNNNSGGGIDSNAIASQPTTDLNSPALFASSHHHFSSSNNSATANIASSSVAVASKRIAKDTANNSNRGEFPHSVASPQLAAPFQTSRTDPFDPSSKSNIEHEVNQLTQHPRIPLATCGLDFAPLLTLLQAQHVVFTTLSLTVQNICRARTQCQHVIQTNASHLQWQVHGLFQRLSYTFQFMTESIYQRIPRLLSCLGTVLHSPVFAQDFEHLRFSEKMFMLESNSGLDGMDWVAFKSSDIPQSSTLSSNLSLPLGAADPAPPAMEPPSAIKSQFLKPENQSIVSPSVPSALAIETVTSATTIPAVVSPPISNDIDKIESSSTISRPRTSTATASQSPTGVLLILRYFQRLQRIQRYFKHASAVQRGDEPDTDGAFSSFSDDSSDSSSQLQDKPSPSKSRVIPINHPSSKPSETFPGFDTASPYDTLMVNVATSLGITLPPISSHDISLVLRALGVTPNVFLEDRLSSPEWSRLHDHANSQDNVDDLSLLSSSATVDGTAVDRDHHQQRHLQPQSQPQDNTNPNHDGGSTTTSVQNNDHNRWFEQQQYPLQSSQLVVPTILSTPLHGIPQASETIASLLTLTVKSVCSLYLAHSWNSSWLPVTAIVTTTNVLYIFPREHPHLHFFVDSLGRITCGGTPPGLTIPSTMPGNPTSQVKPTRNWSEAIYHPKTQQFLQKKLRTVLLRVAQCLSNPTGKTSVQEQTKQFAIAAQNVPRIDSLTHAKDMSLTSAQQAPYQIISLGNANNKSTFSLQLRPHQVQISKRPGALATPTPSSTQTTATTSKPPLDPILASLSSPRTEDPQQLSPYMIGIPYSDSYLFHLRQATKTLYLTAPLIVSKHTDLSTQQTNASDILLRLITSIHGHIY